MVFECKFKCGMDLYKSVSGDWLELDTDKKHECPNLAPKKEEGTGFGYANRDPSQHHPSQYVLDREEWKERIRALENTVEEIQWRIVNLESK